MSSKARSLAATSGRKDSQRNKKKKKLSPATEPTSSISSLPDDLLRNCLARVSRLYHPTLSHVCKKFRTLVKSPELYKIRSLLNRTEKCLYLCLRYRMDPVTQWFTLTKTPGGSYGFNEIRSPQGLLPCQSSTLAAVGSNLYKIGGADSYSMKFGKLPSSSYVSILDCSTHTWHATRNMQVRRNASSTASVVDGKIYVAGGSKEPNGSPNWVEVFDPETQTWSFLKTPYIEGSVVKSFELEGKFYLVGDHLCMVYDPKEGRWSHTDLHFSIKSSYCVIDKVLFLRGHGVFRWYDFKVSLWKKVNGLEGLPDFGELGYCKMVDLGGNMAVLWEEYCFTPPRPTNMFWCCEIALEKRHGDDGDEIWGNVKWSDVVLTVLANCSLISQDVISATV